ncbi:hypothetical protein [Sulfurimonas sp.]
MKQLKNWFVRFETIKGGSRGFINIADYIHNDMHHNHEKTGHKIISYNEKNIDTVMRNYLSIQQKLDNEKLLKGVAGRKASYGKSLVLSFPPDISLTDTQYKEINDIYIKSIVEFISKENRLNYTDKQVDKFAGMFILSSLHKQKNSNDHLNFIIPNVFRDYNNNNQLKRIDLGKKKYSYFLKKLINKVMLDKFNINYLTYEIQNQRTSRKRKNIIHHTKDKLDQQLQTQKKLSTQLTCEIEKNEGLTLKLNKLIKRMEIYSQRAKEELNKDKEEQNLQRLEKNQQLYEKSKSKYDLLKKALSSATSYNSPSIDLKPK